MLLSDNAFSVENADYVYPGGTHALYGINLNIKKGEFVAIVGHNGSGKSTLALLLSGLEIPTKGNVFVNNINTRDKKQFIELRKYAGVVFQNPENQLVFEKVHDDIRFALKNLKLGDAEIEKRISFVTKELKIEDFKDSFQLSMGQKQRAAIAGVLAMKPECIIFDEPTAMLDPKGKKDIHKTVVELHKTGLTIVYVTNIIDEVLSADRIIILDEGMIKSEYKKSELFDNIDNLKKAGLEIPVIMDLLYQLKQNGIELNVDNWQADDVSRGFISYVEKNNLHI
jgi:energy-coupling factor transport system ATP-binding protein